MSVPPKKIDPALARVIERLRLEQGISQEMLARSVPMSTNSYRRIEKGQTGPAWVTVRAIAEALGVDMAALGRMVEEEDR